MANPIRPSQQQQQQPQPQNDSAIQDGTEQPTATETEDATDELQSNQMRRKSSWAFWSQEAQQQLKQAQSPAAKSNLQPQQKKDPAEEEQNKPTDGNSKIKSVIVDGAELPVKERTSSWSFWSSKANTSAEQTKMANSIVTGTEPNGVPDVVKSDVTKSEELDRPSKKKPKIDSKTNPINIVTPSVQESLPLYGPSVMVHNGFKYIKSCLGYSDLGDLHLYRKKSPKTFKRVLIIGVHGFFPTKMIRPIIGQPTGTSMRFAQVGESAVLEWARENGFDNIEIQKIALEKEGKIFDRVDFYFDVLKKSQEEIRQADFIFVCAHSQGTPVSIILISKLLEYGIITKDKTIGILGMAGINMGPFYGLDKSLFVRAYSTIENASLLELFQFQNIESLQHRKYVESLRNLIANDVKLTFVGSIDDQLVPLYSSIASHIQHPNIFKAVYIDGTTKTPAFVSRIVKLSCILQNIGFNDHGVIKEMSHALAGPITGGGHSKIYNDIKVYQTCLDFTLKTEVSNLALAQPLKLKPFDIKKLGSNSNPYNLPWCARGLFFEATRRLPNGKMEVEAVFTEFEDWHPDSKALEDVKYRLNGIRAKL